MPIAIPNSVNLAAYDDAHPAPESVSGRPAGTSVPDAPLAVAVASPFQIRRARQRARIHITCGVCGARAGVECANSRCTGRIGE